LSKDRYNINAILKEGQSLGRAAKLHWVHWFIILSSLLLTFAAWYFTKQQVNEKMQFRFDQQASQVIGLVLERMCKYEDALWSGVATIRSQTGEINYQKWQKFSETLRIYERYPGINGIGVIYHVTPDRLDSYLKTERLLRPNYKIHPLHDEKQYLPITYIEPVDINKQAVGLDMAHEENRYQAALKARDTGLAQITGPIVLVQDAEKTPGFLFYVPFYQEIFPATLADRQDHFVGLVYAPFITKKLMEGTLHIKNRQVEIKISDGESVLYDEHTEDYHPRHLFQTTEFVQVYGRTWKFDIRTRLLFGAAWESRKPQFILIGGLTIDFLLLLIFYLLARSNKRSLLFAKKMTKNYQDQISVLKEAEKEVLRSNIELEKFAYLASHDLQEPLRMVKSFTDLLQEEYADKLDKDAVFYMGQITDGSKRMQDLVRDLLDYSKVQENDAALSDVNCQECFEEAINNLKEVIRETNADITVDPLPVVKYIPMRLTRLFQNLIGNAIKYRKPDVPPKIHIACADNQDEWVFSISDNGIGIKEEYIDQVFSLFKRLHSKEQYHGTGIGLSICEKIIESLGGRIWITSEFGKGSIFYFSIPKPVKEKEKKS